MSELRNLPVSQLQPNPWNRTIFDPAALDELAASLKAEGVREPLKVRQLKPNQYQIASGHRRWLAAQKAGLKEVPCVIESLTDEQVAEDNITINIQREELPALELARMLAEYMKRYDRNQRETAKVFGKTEAWVSQYMSYLSVHQDLKNLTAVKFSARDLRELRLLPTKAQQSIAKELKEGTLKSEGIQKRCAQLKAGKSRTSEPPPDPLAPIWKDLKAAKGLRAETWDIQYRAGGRWTLQVTAGAEDAVKIFQDIIHAIDGKLSKVIKGPTTKEEWEAQVRSAMPKFAADELIRMQKKMTTGKNANFDPKALDKMLDDLEKSG